MTPYYEDGLVTIYHADCRAVDVPAEIVITDPPYEAWPAGVLAEYVAVKTTTAAFGYPEQLVEWCIAVGRVPDEWATWAPRSPRPSSGGSKLPRWSESLAVWGRVLGGARLVRPRSETSLRMMRKMPRAKWGASPTEARLGDVWDDPEPWAGLLYHRRQHPNEKPLSVMHKAVLLCSEPGETVLDPFMGSGTTLRAAKDLGRKAIGIEVEERWCEVAARRMGQEVLAI